VLIGELAHRFGIRPSALRFYEDEGLLTPVRRERGGRRIYDAGAVDQLKLILAAQTAGFTIREIRELMGTIGRGHKLSAAWHARAHRKLEELSERLAELRRARSLLLDSLTCGCERAADCRIVQSQRRG
jgi:MerR family transcriptional regulator, redox-sensitive transcriptional activator SoxR